MSTVVPAYQFALDPTPQQDTALRSHCGGQRYAYNWGLAQVKANLAQREAERCYGIDAEELTPSLNWSVLLRLISFISAGVISESVRPANSAGRSSGIPVSSSLL